MKHKKSWKVRRTATKVRREARKLAKRLEKEKIRIDENLYAIYIDEKLWLLEAQNAPFYLAFKCLRCGKRKPIIVQSGYCILCHILYSSELISCPVHAQLKETGENFVSKGKCSALRERFSQHERFGDYLIPKDANKCPHCNRKLFCKKCGHKIPIHLNGCYNCDDRRTAEQKLNLLKLTKKEVEKLIEALPDAEFSTNEFVTEALLPALSPQFNLLDAETLLYLLENKLGENPSTFSVYCAIKKAFSQKPLDPLTVDFYRGSGWLPQASVPVRVEPPFKPLMENKEILPVMTECETSKFDTLSDRRNLSQMRCFTIALANAEEVTPKLAERFWDSLTVIQYPLSFEIIGSGNQVVFQLVCQEEDRDYIAHLLNAFFPVSALNPEGTDPDYLVFDSSSLCFGVSFGLSFHWSNLIRTYTSFSPDPLSSVVETLAKLDTKEGGVVQALISPAQNRWGETIESLNQKNKAKYPLFAVSLKAAAFSENSSSQRLQSILNDIESALSQYQSQTNSISKKPLMPEMKPEPLTPKELSALAERNTYRFGFILNSSELAGVCHFPSKSLQHPRLLRAKTPKREAPPLAKNAEGLALGINEIYGRKQTVYLPDALRLRHVYIVGKTGTGKTTLMLNMIKGDIQRGRGVGLIDPHGDLVEKVKKVVPQSRKEDLVYFNPKDESPLKFNLLKVNNPVEKRQVKNDLMTVFKRLFPSSSSNVDLLLRITVSTLLEDNKNTYAFPDLRQLITSEEFRDSVLNNVSDDYIQQFWHEDFPDFHPASVAAVKRRLADIMSEKRVREILSKRDTDFDFTKIMADKMLFLANLSRGILGEDASTLLGSLLISKIQLTAMSRAEQPEAEREPFYLYVDEFQNFVNDSFEVILSEARKYALCLNIAHQFTSQLPLKLRDAVFGNVSTMIVFEVGIKDAVNMEKQLGQFTADDIINLEKFHTFTRIGKAMDTFSMRTLPPPHGTKE